uniref:ZP domain-containing protein n=1 Tax=Strongyloides venezuelensis TaxID=75913 RepID=A0A0K0FTH4_STRVS
MACIIIILLPITGEVIPPSYVVEPCNQPIIPTFYAFKSYNAASAISASLCSVSPTCPPLGSFDIIGIDMNNILVLEEPGMKLYEIVYFTLNITLCDIPHLIQAKNGNVYCNNIRRCNRIYLKYVLILWRLKFFADCSSSKASANSFDNEDFFCKTQDEDHGNFKDSLQTGLGINDNSSDLVLLDSNERQQSINCFYNPDNSFTLSVLDSPIEEHYKSTFVKREKRDSVTNERMDFISSGSPVSAATLAPDAPALTPATLVGVEQPQSLVQAPSTITTNYPASTYQSSVAPLAYSDYY